MVDDTGQRFAHIYQAKNIVLDMIQGCNNSKKQIKKQGLFPAHLKKQNLRKLDKMRLALLISDEAPLLKKT